MSGYWQHIPHTHTRPPIFSGIFAALGTVWACSCGLTYTRVRDENGEPKWATPTEIQRIQHADLTDLERDLLYIRNVANIHRASLGLRRI